MRVLMLAQFYPPDIGGEERHVRNLARSLVGAGHEVEVITSWLPKTPVGRHLEEGVVVERVRTSAQRLGHLHSDPARPHALPVADPAMTRAIAAAVATRPLDVVHAHNWVVNSALPLRRRLPVPIVLTLHDYSHRCATKRLMRSGAPCSGPAPVRCAVCAARHYGVTGPLIAAANGVQRLRRESRLSAFVAVSGAVELGNALEHLVGRRHSPVVEVIPNFVPDELVSTEPFDAAGPLLYAGDLTPDKGADVLLDAYASVGGLPPLHLVGRRAGAAAGTLPDGVEVLDPRPHEEVMAMMRTASAVIVPSIVGDSCPTVVLEAMAAGRPVIGSATGGIVDLVVDGETGLLVPPGDPVSLAQALKALASEPGRAEELGAAGRERAATNFTASVVSRRLEALYRRAITAHRSRRAAAQGAKGQR